MSNIMEFFTSVNTEPMKFIAQIVGIIPLCISYFMFLYTDLKKIITAKTVSDMLWALHFVLLGEVAGSITNVINIFRDIVFYHKDKIRVNNRLIPILFCIITIVFTSLSGDGVRCIFPMVGSCLAVIGFWCSDSNKIRSFNFAALSLWLVYGIITCSISTIIGNCLGLFSIISRWIKDKK